MSKINLGAKNALYPIPTVIVGTQTEEGKNNFITIAHVGIMDHGTVSISSGKMHYSNQWIKKNKTLSINLPSISMAGDMDYAGTVSGEKTDKSELFETVEGTLKGAPLIKDAPISMECEVIDVYDRPEFDVFVCKIVNTYVDEDAMTDDKIDYKKVSPIFYDMPTFSYWQLGERLDRAYLMSKDRRDAEKAKQQEV